MSNLIDGIVSSILFCSALNAPILVFINDLSTITIPAVQTTLFLWISLLNAPLMYKNGSIAFYVLYGILTLLIIKSNQTINFTLRNTTILAIVLLGLIKTVHNAGLMVGFITLLNMCIENIVSSGAYPVYYAIFYTLAYLFVLYNPKNNILKEAIGEDTLKAIVGITSPQKQVMMIIVIGIVLFLYVRSITELYYGGNLLIANPTPLDKVSSYTVQYAYEYTISCWINIDAMPPSYSLASTEYTNVFYGDDLLVTYNGVKNKLRILMKTKTQRVVVDVPQYPLQKWNHLLLSYSNGVLDVFMNNVLVKSATIISQLTNEIVVGAENGIKGEICNMLVFSKTLSPSTMDSLYNQFKSKNPPTF